MGPAYLLAFRVGAREIQAMDDINAMLISVTESRRKVSVSMLAAHTAGELPLTPDEVARCHEDIAACDIELASLKTGQDL